MCPEELLIRALSFKLKKFFIEKKFSTCEKLSTRRARFSYRCWRIKRKENFPSTDDPNKCLFFTF